MQGSVIVPNDTYPAQRAVVQPRPAVAAATLPTKVRGAAPAEPVKTRTAPLPLPTPEQLGIATALPTPEQLGVSVPKAPR